MVRKIPVDNIRISRERIRRAVASSSAIETGESILVIESRLKSPVRRFSQLKLAVNR